MNNKTSLLDIFKNVGNPIKDNLSGAATTFTDNIKNISFIKNYIIPYLTRKNILIGILCIVLIWLVGKYYFTHIYVNTNSKYKEKQKERLNNFLNFLKKIFNFVRKSLTQFTLLILLYILYAFKDRVNSVFMIFVDLIVFILSLINIGQIVKFILITVVLLILCYLGKILLERINNISEKKEVITNIINNKKNTLSEIDEIRNIINNNNNDMKEYSKFIKKNLFDYSDIKKTCNFDKKLLDQKLTDFVLKIPNKFNNNIDVINLKNKSIAELDTIRRQKLEERDKVLADRTKKLNKLQAELTYHQIDQHKRELDHKTTKYHDPYAGNFFCIKEDTLIKMSDNSYKKVKDIIIGDEVLSINNNINKVSNIHKQLTNEDIYVYGINNIDPFFTNTHPIISATDNNIVFSIKPELTLIENPERKNKISKLKIGDMIYINNNIVKVEEITNKILKKNSYVYDLIFDNFNDYTYIANNIIIESQEPKWFKYPKVTGVLLNLLLNYKYEDINIELINKYKNNNYNLNDVIKFYEKIKTYNKKEYDTFLNNLNTLWKNYYNIIQK